MPEDYIQEHFVNGLRDDIRMPNNSKHLVTCDGMKPTQYGAVKEFAITDGTDGLTTAWPWPQMFKGEDYTLVVDTDVLYVIKADGTKQAVTVYESAESGSELMADTDMSDWNDSASEWTIGGTSATRVAGSASAITDTVTSVPAGLYRFKVTVTAVNSTSSENIKMYVRIGSTESEHQLPQVGTMEFDVLTTGSNTTVSVFGEANAAFVISGTSLKAISAVSDLSLGSTSKPFNFTDFGPIWMLNNHTMSLICAPACGSVGAASGSGYDLKWRVCQFTATNMRTMAQHLGRLYIGGLDAADSRYAESEFTEAFEIFRKKYLGLMYENFVPDGNVLYYGMIEGGDIGAPFSADLAVFGFPDSTMSAEYSDFYIQAFRDRRAGFIKLPFQGQLLRLASLGNYLICYGEDGVAAVRPSDETEGAFGVRLISNLGLCDYGALASFDDSTFHMYVANNGKLQIINNELQIRELGYEEFLQTLVTNKATAPPIMVLEPDESDVYIGNGTVAYIRTKEGLGQTWTAVTSAYHLNSGLEGAFNDISPASGKVRMRTAAIDYGNRMYKVAHDHEVGAYDVTDLKIRMHYKNDHSNTWYTTDWIPVIRGGFAIQLVSFYEISYELEFTPGANARIEYIKNNWQVRDQRNFTQQSNRAG